MMHATAKSQMSAPDEDLLPEPFVQTRFSDNVWVVDVPAQGSLAKMSWSTVQLPDNSILEDPKNRKLLLCAKWYVLALARQENGARTRRGGTLIQAYQSCAVLLRWMTSRRIASFCDLQLPHAIAYRNGLRTRAGVNSGKRTLSTSRQRHLLQVILNLANLQDEMGNYGTSFSPIELADLPDLLRTDVSYEATEPVPDDVFHDLQQAAIRWLREEAPKVHKVYLEYIKYRRSRDGRTDNQRSRARYEAQARPILADQPTVPLRGKMRAMISLTWQEVEYLMSLTRAAAFIVIAGHIGMRVSELCSLRVGCLRERQLDGGLRILEVHGTLYKTVRDARGEASSWVAGYDEPDNPVRLAIQALEQLPRARWGNHLFMAMHEVEKKRTRLANSGIAKLLQMFLDEAGMESSVTPHQFRKTFARFVALSSYGSPFILMRHFKHVSVLMTERYLSHDPELLADIFEAHYTILSDRIDALYGADRLGGIAGRRIVANNEAYRGPGNREARQRLVRMTLSDPSAHFRPTPFGLCVYEQQTAKCGGKLERVGLDVCVGCYNFAVEQRNLPMWVEVREMLTDVLESQADLGFASIAVHVQLEQVEKVISQLQESANGSAA